MLTSRTAKDPTSTRYERAAPAPQANNAEPTESPGPSSTMVKPEGSAPPMNRRCFSKTPRTYGAASIRPCRNRASRLHAPYRTGARDRMALPTSLAHHGMLLRRERASVARLGWALGMPLEVVARHGAEAYPRRVLHRDADGDDWQIQQLAHGEPVPSFVEQDVSVTADVDRDVTGRFAGVDPDPLARDFLVQRIKPLAPPIEF